MTPRFFDGDGSARPAPIRAGARPAPRPPRRDPAPSRLAYRLHRMWLTPLYRRLLRVGLPAFIIAMVAGLWLSDPDRRASLTAQVDGVIEQVQTRDAFMVKAMRIDGASDTVDRAMRAMLPVTLPASSFDLDLDMLRARVLRLDAVKSVELRIMPDGVLSAVVVEREPAALWRHAQGIELIDETGHRVNSVESREARPDLPMLAGAGADAAAAEAMALIDAAGPILPRLRGLERMGERRWDVALDRGQRIMLPAEGALAALERALAMHRDTGLLDRDVAALDLRDPQRTAIRLGLDAQNAIRGARGEGLLGPDGQPLPEDTNTTGKKPAA
nr:cell division protein FtsQ/DivIB [Paracoccus sp. S-4012]